MPKRNRGGAGKGEKERGKGRKADRECQEATVSMAPLQMSGQFRQNGVTLEEAVVERAGCLGALGS